MSRRVKLMNISVPISVLKVATKITVKLRFIPNGCLDIHEEPILRGTCDLLRLASLFWKFNATRLGDLPD